jgi:DNA-binding MarR family transcriptional regulator
MREHQAPYPLTFPINLSQSLLRVKELTGSDFPMQQLLVLLDVAANPDSSVGETSERLGMTNSSTSRAVAALSKFSWTKKSGYGLISKTEDLMESRRKNLNLTDEGIEIVSAMYASFSS